MEEALSIPNKQYNSLVKQAMNCSPLFKTMQVERLCNFQTSCKKSLIAPSAVTIIYIRMKLVLLETKLTIIITVSKSMDSGSLTMKSILMVSHLISGTGNRHSLLRDKY